MDRQTIDREHIVARYLAGQLDAAESAAFEAHYAENPDTVRDMERMLRLKEGLAVLRDRGELNALLHRRDYWRPLAALAAALGALAVGVWLWSGHTGVSPIAGTIAALHDDSGRPLHVATTQVLVRMRGAASEVRIPLPAERGAIELRMIPSARTGNFHVRLERLTDGNTATPIAETRATASSDDGFVTAYLDSAQVTRGRYLVELVPGRNAPPGAPTDRFVVELR